MFTKAQSEVKLDAVIHSALIELDNLDETSTEYALLLDHLTALHRMKETKNPSRVSPDTMALIAANLVGIVIVTRYEQAHVITTKAMSFVTKLR